jgi:hypothetical protein
MDESKRLLKIKIKNKYIIFERTIIINNDQLIMLRWLKENGCLMNLTILEDNLIEDLAN